MSLPEPDTTVDLIGQIKNQVPETVNCRHLFADRGKTDAPVNRFLAVSVERPDNKSGREIGRKLMAVQALSPFNIVILFDGEIDLSDGSLMLWKVFNNVDPARDIDLDGHRVVINACKKGPADGHDRPWPDELTFD